MRGCLLGILLCFLPAAIAHADEGWRFDLQPYGYLPIGIKGTIGTARHDVPVDVTLSEIFDTLEFAAMLRFEAWHGRFGIAADGWWLRTGDSGDIGPSHFDLTSRLLLGELTGMFRIAPPDSGPPTWFLDLGLGIRGTDIRNCLDLGDMSFDQGRTTGKGVGMVRFAARLSDHWLLGARFEMALPDPTWFIVGGAEYETGRVGFKLGWRYDHIELTGDDASADIHMNGPYLGVDIYFP